MVKPIDRLLYLSVRPHSAEAAAVVAVDVDKADFFQLAATTIIAMPASAKSLEGREFQSLGEAAYRVLNALSMSGRQYLDVFEAYCTGDLSDLVRAVRAGRQRPETVGLGTDTRTTVKDGRNLHSLYSPQLCAKEVKVLRSSDGSGEWLPIGLLLPIVPRGMPDDDARAKLRRIEAEGRQNPRLSRRQRKAAAAENRSVEGSGLFDDVDPEQVRHEQFEARKQMLARGPGKGPTASSSQEQQSGAPQEHRKRVTVQVGHCIFIRDEAATYEVVAKFEADPPPELLSGPDATDATGAPRKVSRKWLRVVPVDSSLGTSKAVHMYDVIELRTHFAQMYQLHGRAGGRMADALMTALDRHARATGKDSSSLFDAYMRAAEGGA